MRAHETQRIKESKDEIVAAILALLPYVIRWLLKRYLPDIEKIVYEKHSKATQDVLDWQQITSGDEDK